MPLVIDTENEVVFVATLFAFYSAWLNDRKEAAIEALNTATNLHAHMGDAQAVHLATKIQLALGEYDGEEKAG